MDKKKKPFYKKWWVWVIAIIIIGAANMDGEETTKEVEPKKETPVEEKSFQDMTAEEVEQATKIVSEKVEKEVKEVVPEKPSMSVSQENAIRKANDYLDFTAFSKDGLIKQLEFDGFSNEDSTFAVDNITVDWNEQAEKKAKDYLDFTSFSRQGLIDQLEFDGFTTEEATHGVTKVGL